MMKTVCTERAYSFSELTNPDFEFCPYSRAPQAEFDFGTPDPGDVTIPSSKRFTCFEEHCHFIDSLIVKSFILSYPVTSDTAKDMIAPLFLIYVRASGNGWLTPEHSHEVYRELIKIVREYSSLREVHDYIMYTRH